MIDISNMSKAEVLAKLYNASKQQGMGFLDQNGHQQISTAEAQAIIDERDKSNDNLYFDYLLGRVMKVNLSGDALSPALYDRDNGEGAAAKALS